MFVNKDSEKENDKEQDLDKNDGCADGCAGCGCLIIFVGAICLIFPPLWNFSPILAIILAIILFVK